jgi:hypothetical protein
MLSFRSRKAPITYRNGTRPPDLVTRAHAWLDQLLPDLMTARSRQVTEVIETLRGHVLALRQEGVRMFRFKDLVDPLKRETRRRWLAAWSNEGRQHASPLHGVDLYGLNRCVSGKIELENKKKTREDLARTWVFLRATKPGLNGHRPSAVQVSRAVSVDRSRVPALLDTLKRLITECLSAQRR